MAVIIWSLKIYTTCTVTVLFHHKFILVNRKFFEVLWAHNLAKLFEFSLPLLEISGL